MQCPRCGSGCWDETKSKFYAPGKPMFKCKKEGSDPNCTWKGNAAPPPSPVAQANRTAAANVHVPAFPGDPGEDYPRPPVASPPRAVVTVQQDADAYIAIAYALAVALNNAILDAKTHHGDATADILASLAGDLQAATATVSITRQKRG